MSEAPSGFAEREVDGATLVLRDDVADALVAAGLADPESARPRAHATYSGRGEPFAVEVPGVGPVFVRPYLHGGLLGRLTGDVHAGDGRFRDELAVLADARGAGVPVPEPLGIVARPRGLGTRRGWLLVREEPGARDVLAVLVDGPEPAERHALLRTSGEVVRRLHDAGFEHPDLHLKNLLRLAGGGVLVLDLDRVRRLPDLSRERRLAGLFRFDRYAEKQAARGLPVSRADRLRFFRAYAGADWPERAEVRGLAERLARHIARHRSVKRGASARSDEREAVS